MLGAFNDAEPFEPEAHDWISQRPEGLEIPDYLPRDRGCSNPW